ncbi:UbiA family prenyltransferase [Albirhodobacter sp. R86504]|uniref:UbiA family prenyltransferase n=1 Tax=Albirhodobacter sp. R86504 TaxID=3093848 RepID=UPI00366F60CE
MSKPLVLDADGTFLRTDMLLEAFWGGLGRDPFATLKALRYLGDRARLKAELARIAQIRVDLLPVNEGVVRLARAAQAEGREVILASASDEMQVKPLAAFHGLSDRVFASDGVTNLKSKAKADALTGAFGDAGFDYAGNSQDDLAVWEHANHAIVVGKVDGAPADAMHLASGYHWRGLWKAIRPHQWVKNVLLLLPIIAAHEFNLAHLWLTLCGIVAFSAAASSIYIINDLLDLEADRLHPTKCRRPFAAGTASITSGMGAFVGLAAIALGVGALLGGAFFGVVSLYMITSLAYSLKLKRMRWVDVATLAALYTIRVVAGAAAGGVDTSVYMLIFIFPVFVALGCVKRLTELTLATTDDRLPGRGYGRLDRGDLLNVAGLGVFGALLIFFLYTVSDQGRELYPDTWLMWLAMIPMAFWLIRMVVLGYIGKQDYDPIVFALKDKLGLGVLMITLSLMFWAAGLWAQWFGG